MLPAEVEYEIHTSYGRNYHDYTSKIEFPLLISLRDSDSAPVNNAVIALKRLGPDGWSEEEIIRDADKRTDKNGMMLLMYPGTYSMTSSGEQIVDINGAVTVVAEGHRTVTIELREFFKDGKYILSEDTIPHLRLELNDQPNARRKQESDAQQAAPRNR